jgi:antirestriction protein ArdC
MATKAASKTRKPFVRKTAEERAAEIESLRQELTAEIATLVDDEQWKAMLRTAAKFHRYSASNQWWLWAQAKKRGMTLSQVAGFKSWQKLGRQVRKGEKGLKIMAPMPFVAKDAEGNAKVNPDTGEEVRGVRFTVTHVWDISQTDGDPLPTYDRPSLADLTEGGPEGLWDALKAQAVALGFTVAFGDPGGKAEGVTRFDSHEVVIRDSLSPVAQVKVLAHEVGHIRAEHHSRLFKEGVITREQCETEAESIAFIVLAACGIDSADYAAFYVAGWSDGDAKVLQASVERINRTAAAILADLEAVLAPAETDEMALAA